MIADRLRASILQAAISGQLSEQCPEDGTAVELLEEITEVRAELVKEKKLKRQKPLPAVAVDEQPFIIPGTWVWTRLGELLTYAQRGRSPAYADRSPYLAISQKCVRWSGLDPVLARPYAATAFEALPPERILSAGDILWNSTGTGTVGRSTVLLESGQYDTMAADSHVTVMRTFSNVLPLFVNVFISSPHIQQNMDDLTSGTTKQKELNLGTILALPFPLPPLAEQERIVAKLDEVLPFIDQLAELERERENLDRAFAPAIERAILQAAISGQLTEPRPGDGTGVELLATIQAERQQLEKEGKIKRQKPLPPVDEADAPFAVPDGWTWSRLGRVFQMQAGKNVPVGHISETGEYPCYGGNGIRGYVDNYNREGTYPIIGRQGALCGNVNVASGRFFATEHAVVVETFSKTSPTWAAQALAQLNLNQYATATAQPGLSVEKLKVVPVPVPPPAVQLRIANIVSASQVITGDIKMLVS